MNKCIKYMFILILVLVLILFVFKGKTKAPKITLSGKGFAYTNDSPFYKDEYENIDGITRYWWSGNKFDYRRPAGGADINELKNYNAFFLGPDQKILYLTFDEGSYQTYVNDIVDVLNRNGVKGTFFLCRNFIEVNKDLVKRIVESGHSIGNHTFHHLSMPNLANKENFKKFLEEIKEVEKVYKNITNKEIDKILRPPRGEWSFRMLQMLKDLNYKTYFYSANYNDFSGLLTKEKALNEMLKRYHNGAIYLIHPSNKGNYEALESFIIQMKKQGYTFGLVKDIN
ncbi:MAG: polysaccharide deacetylase family protein [Bacilli bacterium]|nr:polysaccharide deacetylase family protein [Bacilli bacterium]